RVDADRRRVTHRQADCRCRGEEHRCCRLVSRRKDLDRWVSGRSGDEGRSRQSESEARQRDLETRARRGRDVIEARNLSKYYSRKVYALRDLTMTIDKGEFLFLTG